MASEQEPEQVFRMQGRNGYWAVDRLEVPHERYYDALVKWVPGEVHVEAPVLTFKTKKLAQHVTRWLNIAYQYGRSRGDADWLS